MSLAMNFRFQISALTLVILSISSPSFSQTISSKGFYLELHIAHQSSFGPSEHQAEIAGDSDSLTYDHKKHLIAAFRSNKVAEVSGGFQRNILHLQSTVSYYKKDIGLEQTISSNEYPFVAADMLTVKFSGLLHLTNKETIDPYGFFAGIFIGTDFPISYKLNTTTIDAFDINDFNPSFQFCWGLDFKYNLSISKKGWYATAGLNGTMPGLAGGIGKIEPEPQSSYSIIHNNIKMYSMSGSIGVGRHIERRHKS